MQSTSACCTTAIAVRMSRGLVAVSAAGTGRLVLGQLLNHVLLRNLYKFVYALRSPLQKRALWNARAMPRGTAIVVDTGPINRALDDQRSLADLGADAGRDTAKQVAALKRRNTLLRFGPVLLYAFMQFFKLLAFAGRSPEYDVADFLGLLALLGDRLLPTSQERRSCCGPAKALLCAAIGSQHRARQRIQGLGTDDRRLGRDGCGALLRGVLFERRPPRALLLKDLVDLGPQPLQKPLEDWIEVSQRFDRQV